MSKKHKPSQSKPADVSKPGTKAAAGSSAPAKLSFPETSEPTAARGATPVFLIALLGFILFWSDVYVMQNGGDLAAKSGAFPSQVYYPYRSYAEVDKLNPKAGGAAVMELGEFVYKGKAKCDACHQPSGLGTPGLNPPLAGSDWVLADKPDRIIRVVLNGLTGPVDVNGVPFNGTMLPWRDALTDADIAAVLSFIRNSWGNKAPLVTPEQVKAIRDATTDRGGNWTADELKAVPDK